MCCPSEAVAICQCKVHVLSSFVAEDITNRGNIHGDNNIGNLRYIYNTCLLMLFVNYCTECRTASMAKRRRDNDSMMPNSKRRKNENICGQSSWASQYGYQAQHVHMGYSPTNASDQSRSVFSRLGPTNHSLLHANNYTFHDQSAGIEEFMGQSHAHWVRSEQRRPFRASKDMLPLSDDQRLHNLANSEPIKMSRLLVIHEEDFKHLLCSKEDTSGFITLSLLVKILAKLGDILKENESGDGVSYLPNASTGIHGHLNLRDRDKNKLNSIMRKLIDNDVLAGFYFSLGNFLCRMPREGKRKELLPVLFDTIALLNALLDTYPGEASNLSVIDICMGTTAQLAQQQIIFKEVSEKAQCLVKKRNDIRAECYEANCQSTLIQEYSVVLPSSIELHEDTLLTLQRNIISGRFSNVSSYLVIQFQLLREDFLRPLRKALRSIRDPESEEDEEVEDVMVYHEVCFNKGTTYTFSGTAHKISFKTSRRINWNRSKKLQYGSLVCLSMDNFNTVQYATIVERDSEELNNGVTTIRLQGCSVDDELSISPSKKFSMIESPAYYEAYAPVIRRLDNIEPSELPFAKYIVELKREVALPSYIRDTDPVVDLKRIVCDCEEYQCEHRSVEIINQGVWDALDTSLLDSSQKKALHMALTQEIALIQGPPGTGKTYVGLKVIEALLRNAKLWRSALSSTKNCPIVVICYTNHALDQFLEGILSIGSRIEVRRIGSRSKSEAICNLNLQQFVRRYCKEHHIFNPVKSCAEKQKLVEALKDFKSGQFCREKCQLYCYFLSSCILEDLESSCKIENLCGEQDCKDFTTWLDPILARKIAQFRQDQSEIECNAYLFKYDEDDRRDMSNNFDLPEVHDILKALEHGELKEFIVRFGKVEPLTEKTANTFLSGHDQADGYVRLQLFKYCLNKLYLHYTAELKRLTKQQVKYDENMQLMKLRCLEKADVVGMTTTAAARENALISQLQSKILIIEEAAEVLEPQLIASLTKNTQHLILIGDHKQLRPKTNDHIVGRDYKLNISLFERLIMNGFPHATLSVQHRMRPEISAIVSEHIYNGILEDHEDTHRYDNVRGMKLNMFFINHYEQENPNIEQKSPSNRHEAEFLAALCNYLLQQGYRQDQITVITPYTGQMFEMRDTFRAKLIENVKIVAIDRYQGEENDIILLSLVRSKRLGFVKDENRICVALSRAKQGLYCIGNFTLFTKCTLWSRIIEDANSKGYVGDRLLLECTRHGHPTSVSCAADFNEIIGGGCKEQCRARLPCNHVCQSRCHPSDDIHEVPCKLPCPKMCAANLHRCERYCYQQCGNCQILLERTIEKCGHKQLVPCYKKPSDHICQEDCRERLTCGHVCRKKCGEQCTIECNILVKKDLPCGHSAMVECYIDPEEAAKRCKHPCENILACEHKCSGTCGRCRQGRLHEPCREKCTRVLICGHVCSGKCGKNCPPCSQECGYICQHGPCGHKCRTPCIPCPHKCEWKCPHSVCSRNCGEICDRPRCNEKCPKSLSCGHPCIGVCGEPCLSICRQCITQDEFETTIPIFFGNEHEEDARFIVLEDCGHVMEVTDLDRWMDLKDEQQQVKWKCCPQCNTPVMKTLRYSNISKSILNDMNKIKEKQSQFIGASERKEMRDYLLSVNRHCLQGHGFMRSVKNGEDWLKIVNRFNDLSLHKAYTLLLSVSEMVRVEQTLRDLLGQTAQINSTKVHLLLSQTADFIEWLKRNRYRDILTDQMTIDINAERRRIILLEIVLKTAVLFMVSNTEVSSDDKKLLSEISNRYSTNGNAIHKLIDDEEYEREVTMLQNMPMNYRLPLTFNERQMIIKAISAKPGSWYKCPNGHYYQIGDCGGAMQTSKCPDCGSQIGGHSHRLLDSNQHAAEFDQSNHAAWSEAANMQNFDLQDMF